MGRNKEELIKLAEKITGEPCTGVLTKKDALKKIACYYLGEEKEFASIADCLESIVEHGATGGGEDKLLCYFNHIINIDGRPIFASVVYTDKPATKINHGDVTGAVAELLPCDDGKHLFFTNKDLSIYSVSDSQALCQLVYEDGTKTSLKGKFIQATE